MRPGREHCAWMVVVASEKKTRRRRKEEGGRKEGRKEGGRQATNIKSTVTTLTWQVGNNISWAPGRFPPSSRIAKEPVARTATVSPVARPRPEKLGRKKHVMGFIWIYMDLYGFIVI